MAYQTGSATNGTDLFSKLSTFAQANGYVEEYYNGTSRFLSLSRAADALYVTFYWNNTDTAAIYQALGFSAGQQETPWGQVDDSGNGSVDINDLHPGRVVNGIGAGPFTAYHFFAYDSPSYSIHIVLEFSPGLYRHFGFGQLSKSGAWIGGAWVGGHLWNPAGNPVFNQYSIPNSTKHSILLDGRLSPGTALFGNYDTNAGGTLHLEGFDGQAVGAKWGHCVDPGASVTGVGNDRGGTDRTRIAGGVRQGIAISQFGFLLPDLGSGFIPIIPIETYYHKDNADISTGNDWYYLGKMGNVGHIHLEGITPAQELTVGAETWIAFPAVRKANAGGANQESENMGLIYNKVV